MTGKDDSPPGTETGRATGTEDTPMAPPSAAETWSGPRVSVAGLDLPPGTEIGRFTLGRLLGEGGMGVVYLARDRELAREVALKLLRTDRDRQPQETAQRRMLREARAMAAVSHPNLVTIYEAGVFLDFVYIAMEFVAGISLDVWTKWKPHSLEAILDTFEQAGEALAALHEAGIVHRDFKPDNVIVDEEGHVKLLDLGIARRVALPDDVKSSAVEILEARKAGAEPGSLGSVTDSLAEGTLIGTPAYMSPEQMLDGKVGPSADQFAFGVALYEAICGERPFAGKTEMEMISNTIAGKVRPWEGNERVPSALRAVLERMLSGERQDRYASMQAALDAIREAVGLRRELREHTDRWLTHEKAKAHSLPPGPLLEAAEELLEVQPDALDEDQRALVAESRRVAARRTLRRRALMGAVGALGLGLLPTLYLLRKRTRELDGATRRRLRTTLERVVDEVEAVFAESSESLRLMLDQREVWLPAIERARAAGAVGDPVFTTRLAEATRELNRYFVPVIRHSPTISSLMVATEDFELLAFDDRAAEADPGYRLYNRIVNAEVFGAAALQLLDGQRASWLRPGDRDARGNEWARYSPAERAYFQRAAEAPAIGWTEPYLFFVSKEAGITEASAFDHGGERTVLAVDVTLTDLSSITSEVDEPGVVAFVLTRGDEVVALPRDEARASRAAIVSVFAEHAAHREGDEAARLPRLEDLGQERLARAWAAVRDAGEGIHEREVDGVPLGIGVRRIGHEAQDLTLVVVAEEA